MQKEKLQFKIKNIAIDLVACFLLLVAIPAHAASVFVEYPTQVIHTREVFEVNIMVDTDGDYINAIGGGISFSKNLASRDIIDGVSFVSLWVKRPQLDTSNISFAGIVPGGYRGDIGPYWKGTRAGTLMRLRFEAKEAGPAWLRISIDNMLLNDGNGTAIKPQIENMNVYISDGPARNDIVGIKTEIDTTPPEPFAPTIIQNQSVFDGKYALIFETQDKGSGVYYYQVREGGNDFVVAESPYLLIDQKLQSAVEVKAVDREGNIRVEKISATYPLVSPQKYFIWSIIVVIGFLFLRFVFKKIF
ncbi:MAG: hypothetical protein HZC03_02335 [Candidatus Lloydbacteria bacterium]|nr:hypothetical protein [Candidatus Lloydbacteria bacterium]